MFSHYLDESKTTYPCCYDLQKALDSVEYGVLLCRLSDAGIDAKPGLETCSCMVPITTGHGEGW